MTTVLRIRLTPEDLADLALRADERGLGIATFVRAASLGRPMARRKALPADVARPLGDVGRVGGLLRQLRDQAASEGFAAHADALEQARYAARCAIDAILNYFEFEDRVT
jgi:hypothetical protein